MLEKCLYRYIKVVCLTIYLFSFIPSKKSFELLASAFVHVIPSPISLSREDSLKRQMRGSAHSSVTLASKVLFSSCWVVGRQEWRWDTSNLLLLSYMTTLSKSVIKAKSNNGLAKTQRQQWQGRQENRMFGKRLTVSGHWPRIEQSFQACFISSPHKTRTQGTSTSFKTQNFILGSGKGLGEVVALNLLQLCAKLHVCARAHLPKERLPSYHWIAYQMHIRKWLRITDFKIKAS